ITSATYNATTHQVTLAIAAGSAPLADGSYQLRVSGSNPTTAIEDLAGNFLNGATDTGFTFQVDRTPPQTTAGSPASGSLTNQSISQVVVQFSEAMRDNGSAGTHSVSNPAAYTIVGSGPDGVFGTSDDFVVPVSTVSYNATTHQATLTIAAGSAP